MRIRKDTVILDNMRPEELAMITKVSDALAHPARLEMLRYIMQCNRKMEPVCTKDLVEAFDYAQATISQHMKILSTSGLVEVQKKQKFSYFYVNLGLLTRYTDVVKKFTII
ncbi:MAG: metalloregulator ArsR/SmtB family transcription factor [Eubacteriales bacterium]|nr:metalloregulator ArsR/SmtB family transcription factor [Eubacteriales bacterium]